MEKKPTTKATTATTEGTSTTAAAATRMPRPSQEIKARPSNEPRPKRFN